MSVHPKTETYTDFYVRVFIGYKYIYQNNEDYFRIQFSFLQIFQTAWIRIMHKLVRSCQLTDSLCLLVN